MQLSSLLGHTQELLGIIFTSKRPADSLIDTYFRARKYLGSHDRRFIAETTYGTLRHLRKCEYHLIAALAGVSDNLQNDDKIVLLIVAYLSFEGKIQEIIPEILLPRLTGTQTKENVALLLTNLMKPVLVDDT